MQRQKIFLLETGRKIFTSWKVGEELSVLETWSFCLLIPTGQERIIQPTGTQDHSTQNLQSYQMHMEELRPVYADLGIMFPGQHVNGIINYISHNF